MKEGNNIENKWEETWKMRMTAETTNDSNKDNEGPGPENEGHWQKAADKRGKKAGIALRAREDLEQTAVEVRTNNLTALDSVSRSKDSSEVPGFPLGGPKLGLCS